MTIHRHRHPLGRGASALLILLILLGAAPTARGSTKADWFGWGAAVDFANSTWKVTYITYLGSNLPTPHVVSEHVVDISSQCLARGAGALSYPTTDSAYFDGAVYLECQLPSVRGELATLGYVPPSGDQPFCPCILGGGPMWVAGQVRQLTHSGTLPLLDAGDRGVRVSLVVNGATARTKLELQRTQPAGGNLSYTSPAWTIDAAGDRTLLGWDGDGVVAVADHFGLLDYLTDPGWRPFFTKHVSGAKLGYWNEAPTQSGTTPLSGNYRLGMNGGTLYVGYSPASGTYFTGEVDETSLDPGCSGA